MSSGKRQRIVRNYAQLAAGITTDDSDDGSSGYAPKTRKVKSRKQVKVKMGYFPDLVKGVKCVNVSDSLGIDNGGGNLVGLVRVMDSIETAEIHSGDEFENPILMKGIEGIEGGIFRPKLGNEPLTADYLLLHFGPDFLLSTITASEQGETGPEVRFKEFIESFWGSSLAPNLMAEMPDFGSTLLGSAILRPEFVEAVDLANQAWPLDSLIPREMHRKLTLQLNPSGTFRNFSIACSGSSQWQHVIEGEKVTVIAPPTEKNLEAYEEWISGNFQYFLGAELESCHKIDLLPGDSLFIPCGWICCELTLLDTIVLGGLFLTAPTVGKQLKIWNMEDRLNTHHSKRFPQFKTVQWYAASMYLSQTANEEAWLSEVESESMPLLIHTLRSWLSLSRERKGGSGSPWPQSQAVQLLDSLAAVFPGDPPPPKVPKKVVSRKRAVPKVNLRIRATKEEASAAPVASSRQGRRRLQKKIDEDFVTGDELADSEDELAEGGQRDGADEDADLDDEEEEEEGESEDEVEADAEVEADPEEDLEDRVAARRKLPGKSTAKRRNALQPSPRGKKAGAGLKVRERLMAKIGLDPRVPLPIPQKNARPPKVRTAMDKVER